MRSFCRTLKAYDSPQKILSLAGPRLQSLAFEQLWKPLDVPQLASLTALTELYLSGVIIEDQADITALQKLKLLRLSLIDCLGITEAFFAPGAFSALQELCVSHCDGYTMDAEGVVRTTEELLEAGLPAPDNHELGRAVFGHPTLVKVSGDHPYYCAT